MLKKLYSNSGLILIAVLAAGVWYSNITDYFSDRNAATSASPSPTPVEKYADFEAVIASPSPSNAELRQDFEKFLRENPPENATALCADGTYSYSASRRGTCSHHGGVSQWLR